MQPIVRHTFAKRIYDPLQNVEAFVANWQFHCCIDPAVYPVVGEMAFVLVDKGEIVTATVYRLTTRESPSRMSGQIHGRRLGRLLTKFNRLIRTYAHVSVCCVSNDRKSKSAEVARPYVRGAGKEPR